MPLYSYRCPGCGHTLEELTPLNTPRENPTCALCGHRMNREATAASFVVKGYSAKSGYSRKDAS